MAPNVPFQQFERNAHCIHTNWYYPYILLTETVVITGVAITSGKEAKKLSGIGKAGGEKIDE
jgi:hypothetical protein